MSVGTKPVIVKETVKVTVSRLWHHPQIETALTVKGIALTVSLDDFIKAVKQEVGSVAMTFRRASFESQLDQAVYQVLKGIKAESIKVV